ncbi:MAG: cytochrome c [Planctomycetes bacterium]|nr:cytochrome c [Planctomycetota bacterium]MCC7172235.1 cytochrome c [Planctomycetota bacterium]
MNARVVGLALAVAAAVYGCAEEPDPRLLAMTGKAAEGRDLFLRLDCKTCHTTNGERGIGPTFLGVFGSTHDLADGTVVTVDEPYVLATLRKQRRVPRKGFDPVMPDYSRLTEPQVALLVEFLRALK